MLKRIAALAALPLLGQTVYLPLEQHAGHNATLRFFVARNAHLYFLASGANGNVVLETNAGGVLESAHTLGPMQISGFDMDDAGNAYILHDATRVTKFDDQWNAQQTWTAPSPIVSFAVAGNQPVAIGSDASLGFLDHPDRHLTLSAYAPPWQLFGRGADRLGILLPQSAGIFLADADEDAFDTSVYSIPSAREHRLIAAAASPDGSMHLLESAARGAVSVVECDEHGHPKLVFDYVLPEAFEARMLAVTDDRIYIADPAGKVAVYPRKRDPSEGRAIDSPPERISETTALYSVVRKTGYNGSVRIRMIINQDGIPVDIHIQQPSSLESVSDVIGAIRALRFEPAIVAGKAAAVPMEMHLSVP